MAVGFASGPRAIVAGTAFLRRAFELAADVAGCAIGGRMRAEEWKTGLPVVKRSSILLSMCWR